MEIRRLQFLGTEFFKIINCIFPSYMENIFISKANTKVCPNSIEVYKGTSYSDKNLNILVRKYGITIH